MTGLTEIPNKAQRPRESVGCGTKTRIVEDDTLASVLGSTWVVGCQLVQGGREGEAEGRGKERVPYGT